MKTSLFAIALFGALAAPAVAQDGVSIYGIADVGLEYSKDLTGNGSNWRLQSGQQSSSRLGFRGSESLGRGITANFTLESGFNIDDGSLASDDILFSRQAWAGLTGGFGEVRLGRQQTPLYDALWAVDPFKVNSTGAIQRVFAAGIYGNDPVFRSDNTVMYFTPDYNGFIGQFAWSLGEEAGETSTRRQLSLGVNYTNGPIMARFVYHDGNDVPLGSLGDVTADFRTAFIGGTYDFGGVKAHAAYGDSKAKTLIELDMRSLMIGATVPLGAGTLLASYIRNDVRDIDEGVTSQYAIGYSYDLSKRTNLYTAYGYTTNDDGVRVRTFALGEKSHVFNVGVRHRF